MDAGENIILVGFMGAGKSSVGRLLAKRLGRCFVETDDLIVGRDGRSIAEIFRAEGEARFRQLEADVLDLLRLKRGDVIATGGGFPCRGGGGGMMGMSPFLSRLAEGPLLCDGAMGTMLYASGVPLDGCFDVFNANNPTLVQSIHPPYLSAGADLIETNTFGANRFKLALHGLDARVREINARGAKLARDVRETTGRGAFVRSEE